MAMLYEALAHAGQRSGHFTIVATTGDEPDAERTAVEALLQRRVDGVILSTARLGDDFPSQLAARPENPHVRYFDDRPGGYVRCDLNASRWRSDYRLAKTTLKPESPVRNVASFVVENGRPGATRA